MSALAQRRDAPAFPALALLLEAIDGLPPQILARLAERAIERLDDAEPDPDLEDDDPGGGNVEDEGEREPAGDDCDRFTHGTDQRVIYAPHAIQWEVDRDG